MMKKILVLVIGFFILISCDNFLAENPEDQIGTDQYFDKPSDAKNIVNGLYHVGVPSFYDQIGGLRGNGIMLGAWMSGLFDNELKGEAQIITRVQNLSVNDDNTGNFFAGLWGRVYQAISRANTAIKHIPEIDGLSKTEAQQLLAQARFFRAFNYFYLVKTFGGVPLVTKPYEGPTNIEIPRDSMKTVYGQIVTDLNYVIQSGHLGTAPFPLNNFRITKGAAETLLADVDLQRAGYPLQTQGAYAQAADAARKVINSGEYQLIKNGPTEKESAYNVMRTSDVKREYIYSIEYDASVESPTNRSPEFAIPTNIRTDNLKYSRTQNGYFPIDEYIRVYDPTVDLRIQNQQFFYDSIVKNGKHQKYNNLASYLFYDEQALFESGRGGMDIRVYRYAEVLLIAAEAIARSEGVTAEAISYLTDVRGRAYWQTNQDDIRSKLSGLSEQKFVEEVWKERLRELPFSYKVWSDIQRTRKYPATTKSNLGKVDFEDIIGHLNNWGQRFQKHHLLFPIPSNEISRNPKLKQNPGY